MIRILTRAWLVGVLLIGAVNAQTPVQRDFEPVDQTVGDVDPLARSLRVIPPGLAITGENSRVYRRSDAPDHREDQKLYFIDRGVVAEFDRSHYVQLPRQRAILQLIPANTVFHIGLPADNVAAETTPQPEPSPLMINARLDRRYTGRTVTPVLDPRQPYDTPDTSGFSNWRDFRRFRHTQRRLLIEALERHGDSPAAP